MPRAKIISIINWKGGVGKTTLAHNIAVGLQKVDYKEELGLESFPKVLLIDADPQSNLSITCLQDENFGNMISKDYKPAPISTLKNVFEHFLRDESYDLSNSILKKKVRSEADRVYLFIDLITSHPELIYTDMIISKYNKARNEITTNLYQNDMYKFRILDTILNQVREDYDFIIIDCPPNLNYITQNALFSSDYYLIPTIADKLSTYGMVAIRNAINKLNTDFQREYPDDYIPTKLLGIVFNNVREWGGKPKYSQREIKKSVEVAFPGGVFESYLTHGDGISIASANAYPVYAFRSKNANAEKQSELLLKITREFIERCR